MSATARKYIRCPSTVLAFSPPSILISALAPRRESVCPCSEIKASVAPSPNRRATLRAVSLATAAILFNGALSSAAVGASSALEKLIRAREALDAVDGKIDNAKWDGVRTVLANDPVVSVKRVATELASELPQDLRPALVGTLEDLLTALKLLDGVVYGNVFVGEDRQILGTKIDYDTPRLYLADAKAALDTIIELGL